MARPSRLARGGTQGVRARRHETRQRMAKCVHCRERKGKRSCPALHGFICPSCCGTHRLVRIQCPSDCVFLEQGETFQDWRRHERGLAHGREYVEERLRQLPGEGPFAFAMAFDAFLYRLYRAEPALADSDVLGVLESLLNQLGRMVLVEASPNPLAVSLREALEEGPEFEEFREMPPEAKRAVIRTIADSVGRFGTESPRGRGYFDFISRFFREVASRDSDVARGSPREGRRIILP